MWTIRPETSANFYRITRNHIPENNTLNFVSKQDYEI
jgi:hypothetical protein